MSRSFPPLYVSAGDFGTDTLAFFHILERLKTQKRTGWVNHDIEKPESISDHMYRMSVLAMCTGDSQLDIPKCVMMCIVHDLAEAQVGDITPYEHISKLEKNRLEEEAMFNFTREMLQDGPVAQRIMSLWKEYEEGVTSEAQFVKDLDRFEMALQAAEYEERYPDKNLGTFFDSSLPKIRHPEVQSWAATLTKEREIKPT